MRPKVSDDPTLAARFWAKVDGGDVTDCWLWTAHVNAWGYGTIGVGGRAGTDMVAHRVAYELMIADVPDGLQVDHLCGVRACVNPWHLEPVTQQVNITRGATTSLTAEQVCDIRSRHVTGETIRALAMSFGVTKSTVQAITSRRTWRHVA